MSSEVTASVDYPGKRLLDLTIAAAALVVSCPVLLLASVAVRLTSTGPVFYRARRIGRLGHQFDVLKFRSMHEGAGGPAVTAGNDPRITGVGKWLRKTKIDELPQFVNVIRGEMSVVGPRPEDPRYVDIYDDDQRRILRWKPGITSPASLEFRHEESILGSSEDLESTYRDVMKRKIDIDLAYLSRASLLSDLSVLVGTARAIFERVPTDAAEFDQQPGPSNVGSRR